MPRSDKPLLIIGTEFMLRVVSESGQERESVKVDVIDTYSTVTFTLIRTYWHKPEGCWCNVLHAQCYSLHIQR